MELIRGRLAVDKTVARWSVTLSEVDCKRSLWTTIAKVLRSNFEGLTDKQREKIVAVAMAMAGGNTNAVSASLPEGRKKIVFDRLHIMKVVSEAVDIERRERHTRLTNSDTGALADMKFLWLYAGERLAAQHWEQLPSWKQLA